MCVKLLFDQNLSYRLVAKLKDTYPDSVHVAKVGLDKASDIDVWKYAKDKICLIVEENETGIIEINESKLK